MLILALLANLPSLAIALLAQWSNKYRSIRWVTFALLLVFGILVGILGLFALQVPRSSAAQYVLRTEYQYLIGTNWDAYGLAFSLTAILTLTVLTPFVRHRLARIIPIDPNSGIDTTALALAILGIGLTFAILVRTGNQTRQIIGDGEAGFVGASVLNLPSLLFALIGVGFLIRRNVQETWKRLGLERVTFQQVGTTLTFALILFVLEYGFTWMWRIFDSQDYMMMKDAIISLLNGRELTIWQIITVGLIASIAQELLFRGALQPRFGLWLTAIVFTALYVQYSIPATLVILAAALALGWLRKQTNTSASLILHTLNVAGVILLFPLLP